jgi:hypothetical protein
LYVIFWRRAAVAITIGFSAAFSSPLLYSAGIKEFDWTFEDRNVTVKTCALNADNNIQFNTAYLLQFSKFLQDILNPSSFDNSIAWILSVDSVRDSTVTSLL